MDNPVPKKKRKKKWLIAVAAIAAAAGTASQVGVLPPEVGLVVNALLDELGL